MTHIAETGRTLKKRLTEHKHAIRKRDTENGIAVYVNTTLHMMNWKAATVLDEEQHWARLRVKEAIHIKDRTSRGTAVNLDPGLCLNPIWSPILSPQTDFSFSPFKQSLTIFYMTSVTLLTPI